MYMNIYVYTQIDIHIKIYLSVYVYANTYTYANAKQEKLNQKENREGHIGEPGWRKGKREMFQLYHNVKIFSKLSTCGHIKVKPETLRKVQLKIK